MQQSNYPIALNQLYQVDTGDHYQIDGVNKLLSKLSLFSGLDWAQQWQEIQQVFRLLKLDFQFCCHQTIAPNHDAKKPSYHWSLYADYKQLENLKPVIVDLNFDFLLWPEKIHQPPQLLLFDMDSTFIQIEVIDELAVCHGVGQKVSELTESAMQGELDFEQSLIQRVACLAGLEETTIDKIAVKLPLSKGISALVAAAHKNQVKVAIASGGFTPFAQKLKTDLNLFAVKANDLAVANGCLTGSVQGPIVDAQAKAEFLLSLCKQLSLEQHQVMAIGDGANDLLMMQQAGFNLAYYAKPTVAQQARGRMNKTQFNRLIEIFNWN